MKKKYLIGFALAFVLLGIAKAGFGLSNTMFSRIFILLFSVGILGYGLLYFNWMKTLMDKLGEASKILADDPDGYIRQMEQILEDKSAADVRPMLEMNIAWAYCVKEDFAQALKIMKDISAGRLKKNNATVYQLNLAYVMIHTGQNSDALERVQKFRKQFLTLPMGGNLPLMTAFVLAFEEIENGKFDEAKKRLDTAISTFGEDVPGMKYEILYQRIEQRV